MKEHSLRRVVRFLYKLVFVLIVLYLAYLYKLSEGLAISLISQEKTLNLIILIIVPLGPVALAVSFYFIMKKKSRR